MIDSGCGLRRRWNCLRREDRLRRCRRRASIRRTRCKGEVRRGTGEVEDILFDGHSEAECGCFDSEGCICIGKGEEVVGKEEIEACPDGKEETHGPEETFLRDLYAFLWDQPECDDEDRGEEEEKTDGIAVGRGGWGSSSNWVQRGEVDRVECKGSGDHDHRQNHDDQHRAAARRVRWTTHIFFALPELYELASSPVEMRREGFDERGDRGLAGFDRGFVAEFAEGLTGDRADGG